MPSILDKIVEAKRGSLEEAMRRIPLEVLKQRASTQDSPLSLSAALKGNNVRLVAEVKKASPSKGLLCPDFDPVRLASTYAHNGASAISVVTDAHFQGELAHLTTVKQSLVASHVPVLRKDFIFEPYQVYESMAAGADALLLIVAILSPEQLQDLLSLAGSLSMECLVEVHDEAELAIAVAAGASVIGINNRDLRTFHTDMEVTHRLRPRVPRDKTLISESGINSAQHMHLLREWGVNAALVGEALVISVDVATKVRELAQATSATVPSHAPGH